MAIRGRGKRERIIDPDKLVETSRSIISIEKMKAEVAGKQVGKAISVKLIPDKPVVIYGKETIRDVLELDFSLEGGYTKTKQMIFTLIDSSQLGEFVKAVKGYIPDKIEDFEKELLHKEIIVDISPNTKNGRTYYNITRFESIEEQDKPIKDKETDKEIDKETPRVAEDEEYDKEDTRDDIKEEDEDNDEFDDFDFDDFDDFGEDEEEYDAIDLNALIDGM